VAEDEPDRPGVEPVIQRVQHRARHRHGVMRFEERGHVGRHHRDRVAGHDPAAPQRVGKALAALVELAVGEAALAVDDRELLGIDRGRAREEAERRQRREIRRVAREMRRIVDPIHPAILGRQTGSVKRKPPPSHGCAAGPSLPRKRGRALGRVAYSLPRLRGRVREGAYQPAARGRSGTPAWSGRPVRGGSPSIFRRSSG
jgi:hypothetical protein